MLSNAKQRLGLLGKQVMAASTFAAAEVQELGKPLVIIKKTKEPLEDREVRIRTRACGLNFATYLATRGEYQVKTPAPFVPGNEISGEIIEVGKDVSTLSLGDVVVAMVNNDGLQEEVIIPEAAADMGALVKVSQSSSSTNYPELASVLVNYGTAWMALTKKGHIKEGETVLVTGASGGVGLAAVELASKIFNCEVIAMCRESKAAEVRKAGATHIVDYTLPETRSLIREAAPSGVDIVFDAVGGDKNVVDLIKSMAYEGRYITIGYTAGIPKIPANLLLLKSAIAAGVWWGNTMTAAPEQFQESIQTVMKYYADGKIKPHVQQTFSLEQVNEAFDLIAARKVVGKLVIIM